LTASSQAFLSSVRLALLTLTTSRSSGAMAMLNGPVGLSGEECDSLRSRSRVGLGDDATAPLACFRVRTMANFEERVNEGVSCGGLRSLRDRVIM
jgi:hypothetical protein